MVLRPLRAIIAALTALALVVGISGPALGGSEHYRVPDWSADINVRIDSIMNGPLIVTAAETEARAGFAAWNGVSGAWLDFVFQSYLDMSNNIVVSNLPVGYAYLTSSSLSPTLGGVETRHIVGNVIDKSLVEMNYNRDDWHISSSTTLPANQLDYRSVTTHEWGHTTGFFHIDDETPCGGSLSDDQTMCSVHYTSASQVSPPPYRSLQSHESTDFAANY